MEYSRRSWAAAVAIAICLTGFAQCARATTVPITFEDPPYSTTADIGGVGNPGSIFGQDGWGSYAPRGVGAIAVKATNPIAGSQSLSVPGSTTIRGQATNLLTDDTLSVITPTSMSWLVRVDTLPSGGTGAAVRFETGATLDRTDINGTSALFVVVFTRSGGFQYLAPTPAYLDLTGAYSVNNVYRVEANNINPNGGGSFGTYDLNIVDTGTSTSVASATGLALNNAVGTNGLSFFTQQRWTSGLAYIDNITAVSALPGDFNHDGVVDSADYVVWRKETPEDSNKYNEWRSHFGDGPPTGSASATNVAPAVPEPTTLVLIGCMISIAAMRLRLRTSH